MLTEYETHSTLNPKLWDGDQLRPGLRDGFMKIANAFYEFLEVETDLLDVVIIGSSANYNWTEYSDIDLHVIINFAEVNTNFHLVNQLMRAKKSLWNTHYPLTYKGLPIELYAQDLNEVLGSTVGVYSLLHNDWVNKPNHQQVSVDDAAIHQKAEPYIYDIKRLKPETPNLERKIKQILLRLKRMRQTGLDATGEYSIENMAFKYIRNKGYIERLKELQQANVMTGLTMESISDKLKTGKDKLKTFISNLRNEADETKMAFSMLMQHLNGQQKLNDVEWKWVREQLKDVLKLLGLTTMAVAPGGTLALGLMKVLKADKYVLPSSFKTKTDVVEALAGHCNGSKTLTESKLSKKYYLDQSKIHGTGVFANKSLGKGEVIGLLHTINELGIDYDFEELGRMHNHSDTPNCYNKKINNKRYLVTLHAIPRGEELTTDYRLQPDLEQPTWQV